MLNEIRYELEHILISKNLKKIGIISIKKSPGRARVKSFGPIWTPFLRIFESRIAPRCILICIIIINHFFLDIQAFKVIIIL